MGAQRMPPADIARENTMLGSFDIPATAQDTTALALDSGELAWLPRLGAFRIRALEAADRAAYDKFGAQLDRNDLRLRFGGPVKLDSPVVEAQFSGIDHERVEAFAAIDGDGEIFGIAHLVRTDRSAAEIGLIVRSDLKRRGLGRMLLDRMMRHADERGLAELTAQILYENRPMLRLAAELGFRTAGYSGGTVELRKHAVSHEIDSHH
jgi:acetyltransferase